MTSQFITVTQMVNLAGVNTTTLTKIRKDSVLKVESETGYYRYYIKPCGNDAAYPIQMLVARDILGTAAFDSL